MPTTIKPDVSGVCPGTENVVAFPGGRTRVSKRETKSGLVLNRTTAKSLSCPAGKSEQLWRDSELRGFILRCYPNGRKVWLVQFRDATGATRRVNIGDAGVIEADKARLQAKKLLSGITLGENPATRRKEARAAEKFGNMVERYLAYASQRQKASSLAETNRNLTRHCADLNTIPVKDIRRADVAELHGKITTRAGATAANRSLAALSAMFGWMMATGAVEANPVIKVPRNVEKERERVLSDDELKAIWKATESDIDFARIVRLLLLTGTRRGEVGSMQWIELQDNLWTIPGERTKNGLPHEIPITKFAFQALPKRQISLPPSEEEHSPSANFVFGRRADTGFSGWSKAKGRLDAKLGFDNWSLHDLRRTMSTKLHEAGVQPHVVEALLNHISGHKGGVAGIYNKAAYRQQKTEALEMWGAMIAKIVEQ